MTTGTPRRPYGRSTVLADLLREFQQPLPPFSSGLNVVGKLAQQFAAQFRRGKTGSNR